MVGTGNTHNYFEGVIIKRTRTVAPQLILREFENEVRQNTSRLEQHTPGQMVDQVKIVQSLVTAWISYGEQASISKEFQTSVQLMHFLKIFFLLRNMTS